MSTEHTSGPHVDPKPVLSRRLLLSSAGAGGAGLALGALAHAAFGGETRAKAADTVPCYGEHQAGITTAAQDRMHAAGFDVITEDREKLIRLLKAWTEAIAALTAGNEVGEGATAGSYQAPPDDTGEAVGLSASNLTVTVGFGRSLFISTDAEGKQTGRFGLAGKLPAALIELPHFAGDMVEDARSGGDIVV